MKPKVQAILLADHVYKDEFTGKYIVAGIIDTYLFNPNPPPEPAPGDIHLDMQRVGAPYVYVNLTEFVGTFNFELRYLSLTQDEVIASYSFQMTAYDPLKTVQFALAFPTVPKAEDVVALELLCEGEVIGSQRIVVTKITKDPRNSGDLKF